MVNFKIKQYMDFTGTSIHLLHQQTGIRYSTLHAMINNKNQKINLIYLQSIMKALNIKDMNLVFELA